MDVRRIKGPPVGDGGSDVGASAQKEAGARGACHDAISYLYPPPATPPLQKPSQAGEQGPGASLWWARRASVDRWFSGGANEGAKLGGGTSW